MYGTSVNPGIRQLVELPGTVRHNRTGYDIITEGDTPILLVPLYFNSKWQMIMDLEGTVYHGPPAPQPSGRCDTARQSRVASSKGSRTGSAPSPPRLKKDGLAQWSQAGRGAADSRGGG